MAKMNQIKFLSETHTTEAPINSGCLRNIWIRDTSPAQRSQIYNITKYHDQELTSMYTNYEHHAGQEVALWPDPAYQVFVFNIPNSVSKVTVDCENFYHTTGDGQLCSLVIPAIETDGEYKYACNLTDIEYDDSELTLDSTATNARGSGQLSVSWPPNVKVSHILVNTNSRTPFPKIYYQEAREISEIGNNGDIYIKYDGDE